MADQRQKRMGGFYYVDGIPFLTVTTILKVIDKSGPLMWWACGETYDYMMKELAEGRSPDRKASIMARVATSNKAKDRGTAVHSIVEAWKNIDEIVGQDGPYKRYAQAFKDFLDHHDIEIVEQERTVYSKKYKYAGTVDMVAKVNGKLMVVDVKTGKNLYPEVQLQASAYANALKEEGVEVEGTSALLLKEDGKYKFETYNDKLDAFLAAKTLYEGINQDRLVKVGYLQDPNQLELI